MFHGKELRPSSLQPFVRTVAKHIKSLRSQVARAACTAVQKMFTHVPKAVEPVRIFVYVRTYGMKARVQDRAKRRVLSLPQKITLRHNFTLENVYCLQPPLQI